MDWRSIYPVAKHWLSKPTRGVPDPDDKLRITLRCSPVPSCPCAAVYRAVAVPDSSRTYFVSGRDVLVMEHHPDHGLRWWVGYAPSRTDFVAVAVRQARASSLNLASSTAAARAASNAAATASLSPDVAAKQRTQQQQQQQQQQQNTQNKTIQVPVAAKTAGATTTSTTEAGTRLESKQHEHNGHHFHHPTVYGEVDATMSDDSTHEDDLYSVESDLLVVESDWFRNNPNAPGCRSGHAVCYSPTDRVIYMFGGRLMHTHSAPFAEQCSSRTRFQAMIEEADMLPSSSPDFLRPVTEHMKAPKHIVHRRFRSPSMPRTPAPKPSPDGLRSINTTAMYEQQKQLREQLIQQRQQKQLQRSSSANRLKPVNGAAGGGSASNGGANERSGSSAAAAAGAVGNRSAAAASGGANAAGGTTGHPMSPSVSIDRAMMPAQFVASDNRGYSPVDRSLLLTSADAIGNNNAAAGDGGGGGGASEQQQQQQQQPKKKKQKKSTNTEGSSLGVQHVPRRLGRVSTIMPSVEEKHYHLAQPTGTVQGELLAYKISRGTWQLVPTKGTPPPPLFGHTMECVNDRIYVFGGQVVESSHECANAGHATTTTATTTTSLLEAEEALARLQQDSMPSAHDMRSRGAAAAVRTRLVNTMYSFHIPTRQWHVVQSVRSPPPMMHHTMTTFRERIFVIGGMTIDGCSRDVYMFDTRSEEWTKVDASDDIPPPRCGHSAVLVSKNVFVFGGFDGQWYFQDMHVFNVDKFKWKRLGQGSYKPLARMFHSSVVLDTNLLVVGGQSTAHSTFDIHSLDLTAGNYMAPMNLSLRKKMRLQPRDWQLNEFELLQTLGTGTFARVHLCRHRASNSFFAMKIINKAKVARMKQIEHVRSEIILLDEMRHTFVVDLINTFQDDTCVYMLMEYVQGGEFFTLLGNFGRFHEQAARFFAAHLVLVFERLHRAGVAYRDLKPENVLLDSDGYLKLADFGFAKRIDARTFTLCGTPEYMAPEVLLNKGHGFAVDWWSLGIFIYEMLVGAPPFMAENPVDIYKQILRGKVQWEEPLNEMPQARDIIRRFLQQDVALRLGSKRDGVSEIKRHPWFHGFDWNALERRELQPPFKPSIGGPEDTKNFEHYPENLASVGQRMHLQGMLDHLFKDF